MSNKSNPFLRISDADNTFSIISKVTSPDRLSRYHGGSRRTNHPYISGYWYAYIQPPPAIFNSTEATEATRWFMTAAESFTPPSRNLTKVDVPGMGGMASSYVAGQEIGRTFSIAFREYQSLPLMTLLQKWTSVLDPNTGVSPLKGNRFIPANYKGRTFVGLCKPTIGTRNDSILNGSGVKLEKDDIEQVFFFDGVDYGATI